MEAALLSFAAFCLFGVQAGVEVDPNFDLKRSLKDVIPTPAARILALPSGNLKIETYFLLGENCEKMTGAYVKTDQLGHFTSSDEKGKKDMRVVASDANFAIIYFQREMEGLPPSKSLQLYSKDPKGRENLDKFKAYCQKLGLMGELVVPPSSDKCFQQISG